MRPAPPALLVALGVAQALLAGLLLREGLPAGVTYVFTPMVDVVPGGAPLTAAEAAALATDLRTQVDARDIQQAYARMGSTLSVEDLVRGVEGLPDAGVPLDAGQRARVGAILARTKGDVAELRAVQARILDLEASITADVAALGVNVPTKPLPVPVSAPVPGPAPSPGAP